MPKSKSSTPDLPPLIVSLQGTAEHILLPPPLPENPFDLIHVLRVETSPRRAWLHAANLYHKTNHLKNAITVLEQATSETLDAMLPPENLSRLDLLAALAGAHLISDDENKIQKANDVLSTADALDMDYPAVWLMHGWADYFSAKQLSSTWFDHALSKGLVLGAVGLALLYINRPVKSDARKNPVSFLAGALRQSVCPPGVWTALATALYREGSLENARSVARRAVRANRLCQLPARREPLYILAIINLAALANVEDIALCAAEAYQLGGHRDARVLTLIAQLHFGGGDFETAQSFARRALDCVDLLPTRIGSTFTAVREQVRADALWQLARALMHLRRPHDAVAALESIKHIYDTNSDATVNPGVLLRLGLLKLASEQKDDEPIAQQCLERVLKISNDRCPIAQRALGVLLGRRVLVAVKKGKHRAGDTHTRALELLKKGLESGEEGRNDSTAQLVYAALIEEHQPKRALSAYRQAVETMEKRNEQHVDVEVLNNFAALLARTGNFEEAKEVMAKINDDAIRNSPTLLYNRARLAEMVGDTQKALRMYREFDPSAPQHMEARLRLGIVLMNEKDTVQEAEEILKQAVEHPKTKATAAIYLSKLYSNQKIFKKAQVVLEQNRQQGDYMELALSSFMHRFLSVLEADRRNRFLTNHIGQPLVSMLKRNSRNASAANGVGVYFAEWKRYGEARDAFTMANCGANPETIARINLAHTHVLVGQKEIAESANFTGKPSGRAMANARGGYEQAAKLYSDALGTMKLTGSQDNLKEYCELLLYLAWAQAEGGKYSESVKHLKKLVHLMPKSHVLWFNLSLMLFESAGKRSRPGARMQELEAASLEYEGSRAASARAHLLTSSRHLDELTNSRIGREAIRHFERYLRSKAKKHEVNLVNSKNEAEEEEERQRKREDEMREMQKREEEKKQMEDDDRRKKEEELRKSFMDSQKKQKMFEENYQVLLSQRKRKKVEDDEEEIIYEEGEAVPTAPKRKKRRKAELEYDEGDKPKKRKGKRPIEDSGSEYSSGADVNNGGERESKKARFSTAKEEDNVSDPGF